MSRISFNSFYPGFYKSSLRNEVDFKDIITASFKDIIERHLGEKKEFQKTETNFCRWKSTDTNDINIFLFLENPCTSLLANENTWKRILPVEVNCHKIVQKNKSCHPKQQEIGYLMIYNDIYSLLVLIEKLAFFNKIWHIDYLEYVKLDVDVLFFLSWNQWGFFVFEIFVKLKCKTLFSKLPFSKYISHIRHSKLRGIQKYI